MYLKLMTEGLQIYPLAVLVSLTEYVIHMYLKLMTEGTYYSFGKL